eukprot:723295-Pleurochrysis_carterae.AAC.3
MVYAAAPHAYRPAQVGITLSCMAPRYCRPAPAHAATRASSHTANAHVKPHRTAHELARLHPARHAAPHTHSH